MAAATDETIQQQLAAYSCYEFEHTSTGTGTPRVICRIYREPGRIYTNDVGDAGPIWVALAIKKPPTHASGADQYEANFPAGANPPSGETARERNERQGKAWFEDEDNVKHARVFTFVDAKLKVVALANSITN